MVALWAIAGAVLALALGVAVDRGGTTATAARDDRITDPARDCPTCRGDLDIRALESTTARTHTTLMVTLGATPRTGMSMVVWQHDRAMHPVRLVRTGKQAWGVDTPGPDPEHVRVRERGRRVAIELPHARLRVAVTTSGGDRVPDAGYVFASADKLAAPRVRGSEARRNARRQAQAQAGIDRLEPAQRLLAIHLLAREQVDGTYVYEDVASRGTRQMRLLVDADGYRSRTDQQQRQGTRWVTVQSQVQGASRGVLCTRATDGDALDLTCTTDRADVSPATLVLAMEHGATLVKVVPAGTLCLRVTASVPDGPAVGTRCATKDGALLSSTNEDAHLRLASHTETFARLEQGT